LMSVTLVRILTMEKMKSISFSCYDETTLVDNEIQRPKIIGMKFSVVESSTMKFSVIKCLPVKFSVTE
jgi:hypothetical protein